jgi:hypothetical protein
MGKEGKGVSGKREESSSYVREPRCKICTHPKRRDIEQMRLVENATYDEIMKKMVEYKDGITTSNRALSNHFKNHVTNDYRKQIEMMAYMKEVELEKMPITTDKDSIDLHRLKYTEGILVDNLIMHRIMMAELQQQVATKIPKYYKKKRTSGAKAGEIIGYVERYEVVYNEDLLKLYRETFKQLTEAQNMKLKILGLDNLANKEQVKIDIVNVINQLDPQNNKEVVEVEGRVVDDSIIDFDDYDEEELEEDED